MTAPGPRGFELAQVNVARLRAPLDAPEIADFVALLRPINELAERSPGYVWRLTGDGADATDIRAFDDDLIIMNLSVWESLEALRAFTYDTRHVAVLRRRLEWFERAVEAYVAMWWIEAGTHPTVAEAIDRLERLRALGPTPEAFSFRQPFGPPDGERPAEAGPPLVDAEFCWPPMALA
jgi:hypothetical protein